MVNEDAGYYNYAGPTQGILGCTLGCIKALGLKVF